MYIFANTVVCTTYINHEERLFTVSFYIIPFFLHLIPTVLVALTPECIYVLFFNEYQAVVRKNYMKVKFIILATLKFTRCICYQSLCGIVVQQLFMKTTFICFIHKMTELNSFERSFYCCRTYQRLQNISKTFFYTMATQFCLYRFQLQLQHPYIK